MFAAYQQKIVQCLISISKKNNIKLKRKYLKKEDFREANSLIKTMS